MSETTSTPRSTNSDRAEMNDVIAHLNAVLDEDEQVALDAKNELDGVWTHVKTKGGTDKVIDSLGYSLTEFGDVDSQPWWTNPHIARHDPARVLRDIEAKRRLITVAERSFYSPEEENSAEEALAEDTLRLLALPHADHPDYQDEWRP